MLTRKLTTRICFLGNRNNLTQKTLFDYTMQVIVNLIDTFYLIYLRPFVKWSLHKFTKLCELQRLCYGCEPGSKRCRKIERSLGLSKNAQIKHLIISLNEIIKYPIKDEPTFEDIINNRAVNAVMLAKRINPKIHSAFPKSFAMCSVAIWSYRSLYYQVENLRTELYDEDNLEHERKLLELWTLLMNNKPLPSRITKQWQQIGFQGDDPKTDFRGMGILGLDNLLYFATKYTDTARHLLSHSNHPYHGYTFAVVGINLTSIAYHLLKRGTAKAHFYNIGGLLNLDHFHQFYCYLFIEFDRRWIEAKPKSIMDFPSIQAAFERDVMQNLRKDNCLFKIDICPQNV